MWSMSGGRPTRWQVTVEVTSSPQTSRMPKRAPPTKRRNPLLSKHFLKRRARDSNPQPVARHLISSQAANHSLTLHWMSRVAH